MEHRFEVSQELEKEWEPVIDGILENRGWTLTRAILKEEFKGIDRKGIHPDKPAQTFEYKFDQKTQSSNNLFIETLSSDVTNRDGWALTCQADWLLYYAVPHELYAFRPEVIKSQLPVWESIFPYGWALNRYKSGLKYRTGGILVPREIARPFAAVWRPVTVQEVNYFKGSKASCG